MIFCDMMLIYRCFAVLGRMVQCYSVRPVDVISVVPLLESAAAELAAEEDQPRI